jgi:uncharacterized protein
MQARLQNFLLACAIAVAAGVVPFLPARAAEPLEIRWEQLVPEAHHQQSASRTLMAKLASHGPMNERATMSVSQRSDLVEAYDGARVRITGFAVPFNNEEPPYRRLLLIPFSGACVKFPPPRNQAILLSVAQGITLTDFVYPVAVTGVMTVEPAETDIAKTGYRITIEAIAPAE